MRDQLINSNFTPLIVQLWDLDDNGVISFEEFVGIFLAVISYLCLLIVKS